MPHQCLSCGFAFEEGSSDLLNGCPGCKGTRFFYSKDAVDADERKRIADDAQKDLRQVVTEMLLEANPEARKTIEAKAGEDGWAQLRPRDLRRLVKQVQADARKRPTADEGVEYDDAVPAPQLEAARRRVTDELAAAAEDEKPDTVTVGDGRYEIDVQGLLEKDPIVIQKDGAYLIHLPSLFQDKR